MESKKWSKIWQKDLDYLAGAPGGCSIHHCSLNFFHRRGTGAGCTRPSGMNSSDAGIISPECQTHRRMRTAVDRYMVHLPGLLQGSRCYTDASMHCAWFRLFSSQESWDWNFYYQHASAATTANLHQGRYVWLNLSSYGWGCSLGTGRDGHSPPSSETYILPFRLSRAGLFSHWFKRCKPSGLENQTLYSALHQQHIPKKYRDFQDQADSKSNSRHISKTGYYRLRVPYFAVHFFTLQ